MTQVKNNVSNTQRAFADRIARLKQDSTNTQRHLMESIHQLEVELAPAKLIKNSCNALLAAAQIPLLTTQADLLSGGAWMLDRLLGNSKQEKQTIQPKQMELPPDLMRHQLPQAILWKLIKMVFRNPKQQKTNHYESV